MLLNSYDLAMAAFDMDLSDSKAKEEWYFLLKTYQNALSNPPLGVVGVGAITYAESKLVQAQQHPYNLNRN